MERVMCSQITVRTKSLFNSPALQKEESQTQIVTPSQEYNPCKLG